MTKNRVLIVAPHMDDAELGVGGTIGKHVDDGDDVTVLFLCGREYNWVHSEAVNAEEWKNVLKAKEKLGYKEALHATPMMRDGELDTYPLRDIIAPIERVSSAIEPDIVYIPWKGDVHQDHQAVFKACMIAFRPVRNVCRLDYAIKRLLCYEVPSTTDQNPYFHSFRPNVFVSIGGSPIGNKVEALKCYKRECRINPHPRSSEGIYAYGRFRALQGGIGKYAEAFMLIRELRD